MEFGIYDILYLIGSLGFFIYGMKIMSEGIQKFAGNKMRSLLSKMTNNKFAGIFTGFLTTSIIQSSSATTVMVVSFVNAGLLTLKQAIGVIMGANIGTTITAFLVLGLGFGKVSLGTYAIPIIAFGLPLLFSKKDKLRSFGDFLIGFALLFMGLDALKNAVPDIDGGIYHLIEPLTGYGIFSVILFVLIGTLVTVIVQSSSAAMALTLVLCTKGLPFEFAAAIVLGENIGTTITANLAALIGNIHAKRAAVAHLMFNVFGVLWMLVLFYFVIDTIEILMVNNDLMLPLDKSSPEKLAYSKTQWSLATFHLIFNIANTSLLLWFIPFIQRSVIKLIPIKDEDDEHFQLKFIGTNALTNEFSLLEAQKEMMKFGKITAKMNGFIKSLLVETDSKKSSKLIAKIQKYEEITDRVETEVAEYLSKVSEGELSESASVQIRGMMSIAGDLENIGDIYFQMSKTIDKKIQEKIYLIPEQRNNLLKMLDMVNNAFNIMNTNLEKGANNIIIEDAYDMENKINSYRDKLRNNHLKSIEKNEYSVKSGLIYSDLFFNCEKIGDHIINVNEGLKGEI